MKQFFLYFFLLFALVIVLINNEAKQKTNLKFTSKKQYKDWKLQEKIRKKIETNDFKTKKAKEAAIYEKLIRGKVKVDENGVVSENTSVTQYPAFYKVKEFEKAKKKSAAFRKKTLSWQERGPGNFSGRVMSLLVDPNDINIWYAGTAGGGVFKTSDYGENWLAKTDDLPNLTITTVAMSKANSNVIYAGTGDAFIEDDHGDGLFKSIDAGESWSRLTSTETNDFVYTTKIIVAPSNEDSLLVSTTTGIFYSWNGGTSFTKASGITGKVTALLFSPDDFSIQYAAVQNTGVYKSLDSGVSWSLVNNLSSSAKRIALAISKTNPNYIYGLTDKQDGFSGIFKSSDAGNTWSYLTQTGSNDVNVFITYGTKNSGGQGWYDQSLVVSPNDSDQFFVGGIDLYRASTSNSTNLTIERRSYGYSSSGQGNRSYSHVDQHAAIYIEKSDGSYDLLFGNDGGVFLSTDNAQTFVEKTNGLRNVQFYGASRSPDEKKYFAGAQDNGTWLSPSDALETSAWLEKIGGDGFNVVWNYGDAQQLIGGSQNQNLRKSTDGGESFSLMSNFTNVGQGAFINFIASSQQSPGLLVVPSNNVLNLSTDFGDTWSTKNIGGRSTSFSAYSFIAKISEKNPNIIWAGDYLSSSRSVALSVNAGESFTQLATPTAFQTGSYLITGIATHPTQDSTAYIMMSFAGKAHVLRTLDLGATWSDLTNNNGFPDVATYDLKVLPHSLNELWVGTEIGLFISTDNGASWQYSNNGLPAASVRDIHIVKDEILLATHGRGLFTTSIPEYNPEPFFIEPNISISQHEVLNQIVISISNKTINDSITVEYTLNGVLKNLNFGKVQIGNFYYSLAVNEGGSYDFIVKTHLSTATHSSTNYNVNMTFKNDEGIKNSYLLDFDTSYDSNEYSFDGLSRTSNSNFSKNAIHSPHPYSDNTEYSFTIKKPLRIAASGATLTFDEVALVEPGDSDGFWDYVVVEASTDLFNWKNITAIYDARQFSEWENAFNSSGTGSSTLIKSHSIDLSNYYNENDVVFFRFKLVSDAAVTGWGWFIDNINAQNGSVEQEEDGPNADMIFSFAQNPSFPKNAYFLAKSDVELSSISLSFQTGTENAKSISLESFLVENNLTTYLAKNIEISEKQTNHFYITTRAKNSFGNPNVNTLTDTFSVDAYIVSSAAKHLRLVNGSSIDIPQNTFPKNTQLLLSSHKNDHLAEGHIEEQLFLYSNEKASENIKIQFDYRASAYDYSIFYKNQGQWLEKESYISGKSIYTLSTDLGNYALVKLKKSKESLLTKPNYKLGQNYPNPFNPSTIIPFSLKNDGTVKLVIFNSIGQKVRTLLNEFRLQGDHKIVWNGRNNANQKLASGIYFYQLITNENVFIKKMMLLK